MPQGKPDVLATAWRDLCLAPGRAPSQLERLAVACLQAQVEDSRLGDLSEKYVRTHERARIHLGSTSWAMAASHLVADLHYLLAAANVILFARMVDPALRLADNGVAALVALNLRERTMTMLRVAAGRLVLPALLLVGSALLINSAVDVWYTWRHTEALMARLQREKAEAAASRIEQQLVAVQRQIGWTTHAQWSAAPVDQRRFDFIRMLRQVPEITELVQVDGEGREQLKVTRLAMDTVGSLADWTNDPRYREVMQNRNVWFSPFYLLKGSEPYVSVSLARVGRNNGAVIAAVNLKVLWDVTRAIEIGEAGYAYVVDGQGRLIAHRDVELVRRQTDLSSLPQVAAALATPASGQQVEGKTFDTSLAGTSVLSVNAAVPTLGWRVFVELPAAEARAALWSALIRGFGMLGLGLLAALLAGLLAVRRVALVQTARA